MVRGVSLPGCGGLGQGDGIWDCRSLIKGGGWSSGFGIGWFTFQSCAHGQVVCYL